MPLVDMHENPVSWVFSEWRCCCIAGTSGVVSINRITAGAGDAPCQDDPDFIYETTLVRALRQIFPTGAVPAGAFYQVPDFKVKFVSFDDHGFFS